MPDPGCFWHGVEPIPAGAFLVCGECGHCWPTAEDLMRSVIAACDEMDLTIPASVEEVFHCPLCAHDF